MELKRRTDLSLNQLIAIATGKVSAPSCYDCSGKNSECEKGVIPVEHAASDIGVIFNNTGDTVAEKVLVAIMPANDNLAAIGYVSLSQRMNDLSPETKKFLEAYKEDPKNKENMKWIQNQIAELNERC